MKKNYVKRFMYLIVISIGINVSVLAQVRLTSEVLIANNALHFNGNKVGTGAADNGSDSSYDYVFGRNISAHGDCIKTYNEYVFVTWYRGGKTDRHVMLTRYNTNTRTAATIEFPHRHNGFQNRPWLGESHNTIAVGVSPLDGTIHLLYDMHAYSRTRPSDGSLSNDYFRYSYSEQNIATIADSEFTLDKFVQNSEGGYKHLSLNGGEDYSNFNALTYPQFFLNDSGDLFMYMREGGNNNGAYKFSKYDAATASWSGFTHFNMLNARSRGQSFNWGLYGDIKYVNGKMRIGYQRRSSNNNDKFIFQNGIYYAYSDDQDGLTGWKNHRGEEFQLPLIDSDRILVTEPGDLVETTAKDQVYIVGGFDWTVTAREDVHLISSVEDRENGVSKSVHTYRRGGETEFTTTTEFSGAQAIYTFADDIYIIGLENNKVFVEKAKGGTNNFRRVYEDNSGRSFDNGRVFIANGILYYYLMERSSGSAQPVYLQIIDLDVNAEPQPLTVAFTTIENNQSFNAEQNIPIAVDAYTDNGIVSRVEFYREGELIKTDNEAPFNTSWDAVEGQHEIEVIAYSSTGEQISTTATINVEPRDLTDLTGDVYRMKNVSTGMYLKSEDGDVVASISGEGVDKQWEIVRSGDFYNIDSKTSRGILRFAGNPVGEIINTTRSAPNSDSDKVWIVIYNSEDETYSFRTRSGNRYLAHSENNSIEHTPGLNDSSKWIMESIRVLSTSGTEANASQVLLFPNPASNKFTITRRGTTALTVVINDMLGKIVYQNTVNSNVLEIENNDRFKSGLYMVKITDDKQGVSYTKLVIR